MEFLVFGEDWGRHPSSSQHILQAIGEKYPVHWINSIGLRQPTLTRRDLKRVWEKICAARPKLSARPCPKATVPSLTALEPATITKPMVWPMAQSSLLRHLNRQLLKRQLRRHLNAKQSQRIIWAALPSAVDYLDICDGDLVVYYCGDDFSALAGVDHQQATRAEQRLVARADLIFACSPALQERFPASKTVLLPHGVHLSHFAKPTDCPDDIDLSRPSIGFYGSLNAWLDQPLLLRLAKARPNFNFYFIGRQDSDIETLRQQGNIILLPAKPHHQLARYLQHWTMAILPFVDNEQIQACNPLKLREYLAAGCPVISSRYPATLPYHSVITTATSTDEWLTAIDHYIQWTPQQRQSYSRQAYRAVANESWDHRAIQAVEAIQQGLSP
ncbi:glycosyltransferase family 1 protein [Photobacterium gaetbulicola]|uniref:Glycosyltransferase n=1 Tax=Photobacterium gaetbulicola Gung47 TaxID=658445 RepID=A0A0C5WJM3_9GAMM|nr:glycosyltransferase [Photobacterium gaetbulicola]AJR07348.1 glycosyltransferase [Photobacterium gaetbulicola Gung47]PSU13612.1 glycosyltransferase family 1 protein [Photobacterium gaetbulicola]